MEMGEAKSNVSWLNVAIATCMIILAGAEIGIIYLDVALLNIFARLAFLTLVPLLMPHFSLREWALTALAGLMVLGLLIKDGDAINIISALNRAAFFGAFIYLVTLLKNAAQSSGSVLALGQYMTRQPSGRRYYSLAFGGHIMGVLLNFGAISLLTPLIQRGVRASGQSVERQAVDEQRQISGLLRGFSWMILWSPTALTQAVLFTSFAGVQTGVVMLLGISASLVMIFVGRTLDLLRWRSLPAVASQSRPTFPKTSGIRFATICGLLIATTYLVLILADVSAAVALMLVAPIIMVAWIFEQNLKAAPSLAVTATLRRLKVIFVDETKDPALSAFVLGAAGFIGEAGARLAPVAQVAEVLNISQMPVWLFLVSLPVLITICGQIALSPILVVVFLAAVINELPMLPADPNLIVFALGAGWALSMSASPNASATLLISAITNIAPTTLTWRWNGLYALVCFVLFAISFYVLSLGFAS